MMDCLREIADLVADLPDRPLDDIIIGELPKIESKMSEILQSLRTQIDNFARRKRNADHDALGPACSRARSQNRAIDGVSADAAQRFNNWVVTRKKTAQAPIIAPRSITPSSREIAVPIVGEISLRAIEITSIGDISQDGILYYIPPIKRFALRFAGFTFQGNIGIVYVGSGSIPHKVHDCTARHCNIVSCNYYHNPLRFQGSTDIRNFVASSWIYDNRETRVASARDAHVNPRKSRKLSSRANLEADIATITPQDLSYYNEQFMHDLLCAIVMNSYVKT